MEITMTEMTVIEPVTGEDTNLELHTELCAQRYTQLIVKFDEVDSRLSTIEKMLTDIHAQITQQQSDQTRTHLKWAGAVITALVAIVSGVVMYRLNQ